MLKEAGVHCGTAKSGSTVSKQKLAREPAKRCMHMLLCITSAEALRLNHKLLVASVALLLFLFLAPHRIQENGHQGPLGAEDIHSASSLLSVLQHIFLEVRHEGRPIHVQGLDQHLQREVTGKRAVELRIGEKTQS